MCTRCSNVGGTVSSASRSPINSCRSSACIWRLVDYYYISTRTQGSDEYKLTLRRTLYRLVNLQCVMVWREVALKVKRRFPTMDHVVGSGLMTEHEHTMYNRAPGKWWLPTMWMQNLIIKWVVFMREMGTQLIQTIRGRCYQ